MTTTQQASNHFDVLIVGAGISGIGAAYHMKDQCSDKTFCVLEGMESFGGTWLLHNYPGVRSDSDLYTFGYRFKPWTGKPIASGAEILQYMGEVINDHDLDQHIRYNQNIIQADWSNDTQQWTLTVQEINTDTTVTYTCNFLWMCQGYYDHAKGHTPEWAGMELFKGDLIHPQHWPNDYDYSGKKVVIIGSGATAATLAPKMAEQAEHVTVLQRSPTYFYPGKNENPLADQLRELEVDESWIHEITRRQILKEQHDNVAMAKLYPDEVKTALIQGVKDLLPEGYDVDRHFTPNYKPWTQRIAFVPNGDIFAGISSGKASIVTDEIENFTEQGIQLKSGESLDADLVVSATGFNLNVLGGINFTIDGTPINFQERITYRGMMFTDMPNMAWIMGYFRASWTLRVDLISDFVCRLLKHMDDTDSKQVTIALRKEDEGMELLPWGDEKEFNPGYLQRARHLLPKRGSSSYWQHTQDYWVEREELPKVDLTEEIFSYK